MRSLFLSPAVVVGLACWSIPAFAHSGHGHGVSPALFHLAEAVVFFGPFVVLGFVAVLRGRAMARIDAPPTRLEK